MAEDSQCISKGQLMLTPYIKAGNICEGQNASRVPDFIERDGDRGVSSHSGFISVSETNHLFFWFFPNVNPSAPIILWLQGGPGESSLFGLFSEHGPYVIEEPSQGKVARRAAAWTQTHSLIYLDSPVGAGFSYPENSEGYAKTLDDVSRDVHQFLLQFFQLFPQQRLADFYVAGESYGGKYVPAVTRRIHLENQSRVSSPEKINLKGMAIGNAFSDPTSTLDYGNYLFGIGLLGVNERRFFQQEEERAKEFIRKKNYGEAFKVIDKLVFGTLPGNQPSHFEQLTGIRTMYNYSLEEDPKAQTYFVEFVEKEWVRDFLHVGSRPFAYNDMGGPVLDGLYDDVCQSTKPWIEEILSAPEAYKVLFYTGQSDVACPERMAHNLLQSLVWPGAENFRNSRREIWRSKTDNSVTGYCQSSGGLSQVLIRNAGHRVPFDKPEAAFDMINRFTSGSSFSKN